MASVLNRTTKQSGPYALKLYKSCSEFPESVQRLLEDAAVSDFFASLIWFQLVEDHLESSVGSILYACLYTNGQPSLVLPCMETHGGQVLQGLSTVYTTVYGPICKASQSTKEEIGALVSLLIDHPKKWTAFRFRMLREKTPSHMQITSDFQQQCKNVLKFQDSVNWFEPVSSRTADDYLSGRPSAMRNTLRRKTEKLDKESDWKIGLITGQTELDAARPDYWAVYAASWKDSEQRPEFVNALLDETAKHGLLRLSILTINAQPAAMQFWIVAGKTATIYKLAYDPKFQAFSPGSILTRYMVQHVINRDQVDLIDFGIGNEPYKQDWMSQSSPLAGITAFNPKTFSGRVLGPLYLLAKRLRGQLRGENNDD